ncbi:MAG: YihY/virulence factor BrkB family protein [Chloroflexota bacterium]|nr:YihY/virulence factor BrkB family protein [Chloroflexota bacterium]
MLPLKNIFNVFKRAGKEFGQDDIGNMAAALAFATFASIFPLILFIISLLTFFLDQKSAADFVLTRMPNPGGSDASVLTKTITDVIAAKGPGTGIAAIIGLVSLLVSASGVFGTLQAAVNRAFDCTKAGSLVKDKVIAFLLVLGVAVVMLISTAISTVLNGIQQGTAGIIGQFPLLWQIIGLLVSLALMTGILTVLFHTLPRCSVDWQDVWPAAALTAIGWEIFRQIFAFYLGNFANYQAVYGALGSIIAIQTWILFSSMILLFGAEFASEYAGERTDMAGEKSRAAAEEAARKRRAAAAQKVEDQRVQAGNLARRVDERRTRVTGLGGVPPQEHGMVFAVAAGVAGLLGLLGKLLGGRGRA